MVKNGFFVPFQGGVFRFFAVPQNDRKLNKPKKFWQAAIKKMSYKQEGVSKIKLGADYTDYTDLYLKYIPDHTLDKSSKEVVDELKSE